MSSTSQGAYIVIVEDSMLVSDALRILFTEHGFRVVLAQSIASALEACAVDRPDVLLLDLTLPDGDGLSVLSQLDARNLPRPQRTIAVTGHGAPEVARRCLEAGCERVLLKPVSIRELLRIIQDGSAS